MSAPDKERIFYEVESNWDHFEPTEVTEAKIAQLLELIPARTKRICDLGCGHGMITDRLAERYEMLGLDWSMAALRRVSAPRVCATVTTLPLRRGHFDLVLSSELLEHLSEEVLRRTLSEIESLKAPYLLISVPNEENTHINEVLCRQCGLVFNASHHYRSISTRVLEGYFPGYALRETAVGGVPRRDYPLWLLRMRQRLGKRWFQVPSSRQVVCPACDSRDFPPARYNPVSFLCDGINRLISRRRPYWLFALFERRAMP